MNKYVTCEAVGKEICKACRMEPICGEKKDCEFFDVLNFIPSADVRSVVRERWLKTDAFPHRVYCSVCYKTYVPNDRWQIWVDGDLPKDFCSNCGAYMVEG